jgi:hypothetical protein
MATKKTVTELTSKAEGRMPDLTIRNVKLIYKNFAGVGKKYNAEGLRNFNILLDLETAKMLSNDGWNIKYDEPRNEGDDPIARMKVNFSFAKYPPRILLISGKNNEARSVLDEDSVGILDWADILKADITVSGSRWEKGNDHGVKTWLRKLFVTLSPDDLESEYMTPIKTVRPVEEDDD